MKLENKPKRFIYSSSINLMLISVLVAIVFYRNSYLSISILPCKNCLFQNKKKNCGPAALKMVLTDLKVEYSLSDIEKETNFNPHKGITFLDMYNFSKNLGFNSKALKIPATYLSKCAFPNIIFIRNSHFVVVDSVDAKSYCYIRDPSKGRYKAPISHLNRIWKGEILVFRN